MITDMPQGRPAAILWRFTIPMLLSAVFQQLYNVADSVVAGRFVGEDALAAVGASFPITMIFMAVALGSNTGCSVIISQLFGAKETALSACIWAHGKMKRRTAPPARAFFLLWGWPACSPRAGCWRWSR